MSIAESKKELRRVMQEQRLQLDAVYARGASDRIVGRVTGLAEFREAQTILCYLSMKHEVETTGIIEVAWQAGKRLAVPAIDGEGEYRPAWLRAETVVVEKRFGVREPEIPDWASNGSFDLAILPGVAFSPEGGRLGHGRGYIDRLLARLTAGVGCKTGICYQCQLAGEVPMGECDVLMDIVVTEDAVYRTAERLGMEQQNEAGRLRPH
jgi:5-formyltetrahydrofolate cyclo-ligase